MFKLILFFFLLLSFSNIDAQVIHKHVERNSTLTYEDKLKAANELFDQELYYEALNLYLELKEEAEQQDDLKINFNIGECSRFLRHYEQSAQYYNIVVEGDKSQEFPLALFYLGEMQMAMGNYDMALSTLEKFTSSNNDKKWLAKARIKINGINSYSNQKELNTTVTNTSEQINHNETSFGLTFFNDSTIIYTGMHPTKSDVEMNLMTDHDKIENVRINSMFESSLPNDNGKIVELESINTANLGSVGGASYDIETNKLYFSSCKNYELGHSCQIYYSDYIDNEWTEPTHLNIPGSANTTTKHPFVYHNSKGESILLFSSNRANGFGGMDIWYSELSDNIVSNPTNLGENINTEEEESSPYYDVENNKLFFSSMGHPGLGELDIFSATGSPENNDLSNINNLGKGINSSSDDHYFVLSSDKNKAYISSNRTSKNNCCDNIYEIVWQEEKIDIIEAVEEPVIEKNDNIEKYLTVLKEFKEQKDQGIVTQDMEDAFYEEQGRKDFESIKYSVQIGAYRNEKTTELFNYLKIGTVRKEVINGLHKFIIGKEKTSTLLEAKELRKRAIASGIKDAFIIIYKDGKRIFSL